MRRSFAVLFVLLIGLAILIPKAHASTTIDVIVTGVDPGGANVAGFVIALSFNQGELGQPGADDVTLGGDLSGGAVNVNAINPNVAGELKVGWAGSDNPLLDEGAVLFSVTFPQQNYLSLAVDSAELLDLDGNPVSGTVELLPPENFQPADTNTNYQITISEVVAYAVAWKSGATWPVPPNPVPISYVVNAAVIWKSGESYHYDPSQTDPGWRAGL